MGLIQIRDNRPPEKVSLKEVKELLEALSKDLKDKETDVHYIMEKGSTIHNAIVPNDIYMRILQGIPPVMESQKLKTDSPLKETILLAQKITNEKNNEYSLNLGNYKLKISNKTNYRLIERSIKIKKSIIGTVIQAGGKNKANIHVEVLYGYEKNKVVVINVNRDILSSENMLYKKYYLEISANYYPETKKLENAVLIKMKPYKPDPKSFYIRLVKNKEKFLNIDVQDWINEIRGR